MLPPGRVRRLGRPARALGLEGAAVDVCVASDWCRVELYRSVGG